MSVRTLKAPYAMSAIALSVTFALAACGGGGGGGSSSASTGVFSDAAVEGLYYTTTNGITGTTNAQGQFNYQEGDTVTFYVGGKDGLKLGSTTGAAMVYAHDVAGNASGSLTDTKTLNILRILQSLDSDANPDNGIKLASTTVDKTCDLASASADIAKCAGVAADKVVSAEKATDHYQRNLAANGQVAVAFKAIDYPTTDADKRKVLATSSVTVGGKASTIGFNTILRSGQVAGSGTFGLLYDANGNPLTATDGSQRISDDNDFSSLLDVHGKLFMLSQFESRPGGFYITELNQNTSTGALTPVATKPVSFASLGGGWVHCAGSRTPWKSHLGSEEYEPDARLVDPATGIKANADGTSPDTYYGAMGDYFGGDMTKVNPYRYGYIIEAKVTGPDMGSGTFASNVNVVKHYSMGRAAMELAYVMPDEKTAYITDDGTMVGLFMYKADKAQDLSAGKLYAAKLTQTSADNGGSFTVSWILLGQATDAEIKALVDGGIKFSDIFDAVTPAKDADGAYACPSGYTGVSHGHSATAGNSYNECLTVKPGMEKAAAFLETRRYAALLGATTELQKEEGITFDPVGKKLYLALSDITAGMKANTTGKKNTNEAFTSDHIKVAENRCGGVYELDVDANYQATTMKGLVLGKPATYAAGTTYAGNTCDVNGIASPDNLTFIPGKGTLIIGEDTSRHQNDLIWSYNLKTKVLTRILSTPYGSETTSPYVYPNINGWGYMMSVVQHPYDESDSDKVDAGSSERRAYTGYIGPFPKLD